MFIYWNCMIIKKNFYIFAILSEKNTAKWCYYFEWQDRISLFQFMNICKGICALLTESLSIIFFLICYCENSFISVFSSIIVFKMNLCFTDQEIIIFLFTKKRVRLLH